MIVAQLNRQIARVGMLAQGAHEMREIECARAWNRILLVLAVVVIDVELQQAIRGFKSVLEPAGNTILDEVRDGGNLAETTQTAANIITANPDLVGMAGFNSESGPGIGAALKEAGRQGEIVATCVNAELQHLTLVKEGVLTACVGQKRQLFTYQGVKALNDVVNNRLAFTGSVETDAQVGIVPIPIDYNTGTYTVTAETVDIYIAVKGG